MLRIGDHATVGELHTTTLKFGDGTSQITAPDFSEYMTALDTVTYVSAAIDTNRPGVSTSGSGALSYNPAQNRYEYTGPDLSDYRTEAQVEAAVFDGPTSKITSPSSLMDGSGGISDWRFQIGTSSNGQTPLSFALTYQNNEIFKLVGAAGSQSATLPSLTTPSINATGFMQTPAVVLTNNNGSSNLWRMKNETIYTSSGGSGVDSFGLSYNGTTKFKVGTSGNVHIDGMLFARYATNVSVQFSDDRYKSRERPVPDDCLSIIQQLKPARYLLHPNHAVPVDVEDSDLTGVETYDQAGLIAQDLERIPELAFLVQEFEGMKTVNYTSLLAYVIKSVQELAQR